jgi:hypothetical protein
MSGRAEEDAEGRAGLMLVLGRAQLEDRSLAGVEVVDVGIEMHLLRALLAGPLRRPLALHCWKAIESPSSARIVHQSSPPGTTSQPSSAA